MKKQLPTQMVVGLAVLLGGGIFLGGEYLIVKWYPYYKQHVAEKTLALFPYHNDALGIDMQVAAGIYGKRDDFPDGVKIQHPRFWSIGPSLTITAAPNPDKSFEFTPQILAKWQTQGVYQEIPRYSFEHTKIQGRDAALIWQQKNRMMYLSARIISPDRIVEADCTPGKADETLYLQACELTLRSIKVAGPEPPPPPGPGIIELNPIR
jgi:hypothetical protein